MSTMRDHQGPQFALLISLLPAVVGLLPAQSPATGDDQPKYYVRGGEARLPSEMRSTDVELIGIERGSSLRARTPVLAGTAAVVRVDREELRQRRLQTYGDAASAPAAPVGETAPVAMHADLTAPSVDPQANVRLRLQNFRIVTMSIGAALLALAIVLVWSARRSARAADTA